MGTIVDTLVKFWGDTGFANFTYQNGIMIIVSFVFLYLAIRRGFEPLLLVPIAFGMLLSNLPAALDANGLGGMFTEHYNITNSDELSDVGLLTIFYSLKPILPSLIFLGVGAMTDFGPLIANPKSLLMGAAAQLGIFMAFLLAILMGFNAQEAASIGIIGGADGPTAIYLTSKLADHLLGPIAVAAYSYMALVPIIQPPIMKLLTTKHERELKMEQLRTVSQREKILFPIAVSVVVILFLPSAASLIGMLMLGNLFKECGKVSRLTDTAGNAMMNIVVILLGLAVGSFSYRKHLYHMGNHQDRYTGSYSVRSRYGRRSSYRKDNERILQDSYKSSYRISRSFGGTYGSQSIPDRRSEGKPFKLSPHARYGT